MPNVICMASAKGGSGKTVLTSTFATFLSSLGKKVLIVDTDASTNGLTLMFLKEVMVQAEIARSNRRQPIGIFEYKGEGNSFEVIRLENGVHLIPSTFSFMNTEQCDINLFNSALLKILHLIGPQYDFIFLDAQAGSDSFAAISMKRHISNQVIIVSEYDPLSSAGIERLKGIFRDDLTYDRTWVLLNKMLPDFVKSFSDFLEVAKYLSPIPWDAEVVKSYARRKLALDLEIGNEFTLSIIQTLKSFLGDEIVKELDEWLTSRSTLLREPVEIQYKDAERELLYLRSDLYKIQERRSKSQLIKLLSLIISVCTVNFGLYFVLLEIFKVKSLDNVTRLGLIPLGLLIFSVFIASNFKRPFAIRETPEEESLKSKINNLQRRIERLEALRRASLEVLIKDRKSIYIKIPKNEEPF